MIFNFAAISCLILTGKSFWGLRLQFRLIMWRALQLSRAHIFFYQYSSLHIISKNKRGLILISNFETVIELMEAFHNLGST